MTKLIGFSRFADLVEEQISEKISRRILSGDQGMVVWWSIGAGVHVEPHSHPNEQIVWMLKGKMEFRLGSEQRVQPAKGFCWIVQLGGYYANNQCVWYDVGDDDGGSHTNCKVCKNGRWFDLDQCERYVALSKQLSRVPLHGAGGGPSQRARRAVVTNAAVEVFGSGMP